ncbi:MAG: hypothetical protein KME43_26990 [Myxacorys chilensis ATA2-1-KO14]|nr:hypothetical protein [Myxacorys chilensis ATA2-1-KO14]
MMNSLLRYTAVPFSPCQRLPVPESADDDNVNNDSGSDRAATAQQFSTDESHY